MSYDIWLEADLGGDERARVSVEPIYDHGWNYTSNVAPMWRKAMPETAGLAGLNDTTAEFAAATLREGIARMEADPDAYRAMDPENGWGDFDGQLDALRELLAACEAAPKAIVTISR